jgi:nitrite reductase/ring-hydroxylating ferredoxin subunit
MTEVTRRQVMAVGAAGVAGVALTACGGGDSGATTTPTVDSSPAGSPAAAGETLVATSEVPVAGGVIVDAGQTKVVVTQPTSGDFVGLSAVCPHQNCLVNEVTDQKIICPCHGSEFSITDGAVIQGPATSGLSSVAVSVNGDQVVLG